MQELDATTSLTATASNNEVILKDNASADVVYGGLTQSHAQSTFSTVANNKVTVMGDAKVTEALHGGSANRIGYAPEANTYVYGNEVMMTDNAEVLGSTYGGYAQGSTEVNAYENKVTLMGNSIAQSDIMGAFAIADGMGAVVDASRNEVTVKDNASVSGSIYGGRAISLQGQAQATNNIVNIEGEVQFLDNGIGLPSLYGSQVTGTTTVDGFSGNTLNFSARPIQASAVENFEHYNFTINPVDANTGESLITAESIVFGTNSTNDSAWVAGNGKASQVSVVGIHSGNVLNAGDTFSLMQAGSITGDVEYTTTGVAQQGISLRYNVETSSSTSSTGNPEIIATITGVGNGAGGTGNSGGPAASVNPQTKALSEGRLAGVTQMLNGADMIANGLVNIIAPKTLEAKSLTPFITVDASHDRYNTGSHVDVDSVNLVTGLSYQMDDLTVSGFLQGGWGSYETHNSFENDASVKGKGHANYYGVGVLGHYDFANNFYADGSIRAGQSQTKFHSADLVNAATKEEARYKVKSNYVGIHIGGGYVWEVDDRNSVDVSVKYLWNRQSGGDVKVAGDPIHFDALNSHRVRTMATWGHDYSDRVNLHAGVGYEYEFDGKAKGTTYQVYDIEAPQLKGGSGIVEIGAKIQPQRSNMSGLSFDVKARGYTGKREGFGASVNVNFAF